MAKLATWIRESVGFIKSLCGRPEGVGRTVFPRVQADGAWTKIDAQNLKAFLASVSGQRVRVKLHNMLTESAIKGAQDTFHTVHSAGVTTGVTSTLNYLYSLTYTFDKSKQTEQERIETAEQREERELLERIGAL